MQIPRMFGRAQRTGRITSRLAIESLETRRLLAADLVALSPVDGATTVSPEGNLMLTFSDDVRPGPGVGRILIKNAADDSVVEAFGVEDSARVSFSGHAVTLDPLNPLPSNAQLYVTIDAGAIRDLSTMAAEQVIFRENFETAHLANSDLEDRLLGVYAVTMTGTLDVQTGGQFTFGGRGGNSQYLAIDLNGDQRADISDAADIVIGEEFGGSVTLKTLSLAPGRHQFEYAYFTPNGFGDGEAFYASGALTEFDAAKFSIIGDPSGGIGLVDSQVTATTHFPADQTVWLDLAALQDLRSGRTEYALGFPVSATAPTADFSNTLRQGSFRPSNRLPGTPRDATPQDFNPNMPAGWTKETNLPQPQPEYNGWTQLAKDFWIAEQGGQARELFERGQGTVAVIDPDAFDDFSNINDGVEPEHNLEGYTTLPPLKLTDVAANSVKLTFDSSFRPESEGNRNDAHPDWIGQTGLLDVSFDNGATWQNVLLKNSVTEGGDGSTDHCNERLSIDIPNPAGGSLLIRFGVVNSQNNWWWAIDNMEITGNTVGDLYEGIADRTTWNFTTLPEPLAADFNGDGKVDLNDFGILKQNFATGDTKAEGDASGDAKVDLTDFGILKVLISSAPPAAPPVPSEAQVAAAMHLAFAQEARAADEGDELDGLSFA